MTKAIFFSSLAVYFALALWMTREWKPLGDEPHYLIAAHSLARDGDLDLTNNYAQRDFQNFLQGETLDPHVKVTAHGWQILSHDLGLPLALALPYALGGRLGAEIFLAFVGALLATQIFFLARDVTGERRASLLTWLALSFTPPLLLYTTLLYPEGLGALLALWSARVILFQAPNGVSRGRMLALALALAALPWLSVRFLVVVVFYLGYLVWRWREVRSNLLLVVGIVALSVGAYFFVNYVLFAGRALDGGAGQFRDVGVGAQTVASIARGLIGWWIEPQRGTLILAPIYLVALAGIPRLCAVNWRRGIALVLPLVLINGLVALTGGFYIAFEVGARYLVVALPLLAAPLAVALRAGFEYRARGARYAFAGFVALLTLASVWHGSLLIRNAAHAYGSVVSAYNRVLGRDVSWLFAGLGRAALVAPRRADQVVENEGELFWYAPRGQAGVLAQSDDLTELINGSYALRFRAAARDAPPESAALVLDVYSEEGLPLAHAEWSGKDFLADAAPQSFGVPFDNPYFNRWGFPLTLQVSTTGAGEVWLGAVLFDPNTPLTWSRAALWVLFVLGVIVLLNLDLILGKRAQRAHQFRAV